jgi:uncharacterized protein
MARSPFQLHAGSVVRSGASRDVQLAAPLAGMGVTGSRVPDDADVHLDLRLDSAGSAVSVSGTVSAPWVGECRRCLREVAGTVTVAVRETFEKHPEEGETYPLHDGEIDLAPLVREAVVPELPQAPLCRADCAGLCPECGADRNEGQCGHEVRPVDDRWAALDQLRDDIEN